MILCDHAGRQIPRLLGDLGAPAEAFERHIAWDIGAEAVARALAERLGATLVAQTYSRLVIDCNRDPARADAVVEVSDGQAIPGNVGLSAEARQARVDGIFAPYHAAIAGELDRRAAEGLRTVLVSVHSFTPSMGGRDRPWKFGVLHLNDSPFSRAVLEVLRERADAPVGDNEPYAMDRIDFTIPHHAGGRGLDYLEIEIRQDLIAEPTGQAEVADFLAGILPEALARATR